MVAVIDYDAGNIKSVEKAIAALGGQAIVTRNPKEILSADHVVLPGVGAFGDAMEKLRKYELVEVIREVTARKTPFWVSVLDYNCYLKTVRKAKALRDSVFYREELFGFRKRRI